MLAAAPFDITLPNLALGAVALAYAVSLIKDWRPIRTLRTENRQLRSDLSTAEAKIQALESEVRTLQKATDLTVLQEEHRKIAEVLERVSKHLDSLDHSVKANTAAIEVVARGDILKEALDAQQR